MLVAALMILGLPAPASATEPAAQPVNLSSTLVDLDAELAAAVATVPLEAGEVTKDGTVVPEEASDGLTVPAAEGDSVAIGLPLDAPAEVTDAGAVTYTDEDTDTALLVQKLSTEDMDGIESAVQALITITSPVAATTYEFPLDIPEGAHVEYLEDGGVAIVDSDGNALGLFTAPWAVDANGDDVPTFYDLDGTTLVQHVYHESAAYPVVADPVWFVPVLVVGARVAVQVAVRASSASAARSAAAAAAARQTGATAARVTGNAVQATYRAFTASNYRHNLVVRTGKNPKNCQAHHTMPQVLAARFTNAGINIHDPKYLGWWTSTTGQAGNHASKARAYNDDWRTFLQQEPEADLQPDPQREDQAGLEVQLLLPVLRRR